MLHLPRTRYLLIVAVFLTGWTSAQSLTRPGDYFQQEVAYRIDVTLNDRDHTLSAFLSLDYTNHSPDTLGYIWFHLWPNAYKINQDFPRNNQVISRFEIHLPTLKGYPSGWTATILDDPKYKNLNFILPQSVPQGFPRDKPCLFPVTVNHYLFNFFPRASRSNVLLRSKGEI